ncbi:MAG: hypothetical protein EXR75_13625 [Myxococcales bacterium]|nr:hypothetical protein [Myxococcales bacterium]
MGGTLDRFTPIMAWSPKTTALGALLLALTPALATAGDPAREAAASAVAPSPELPLPTLSVLAPIAKPLAKPAQLASLDARLEQLLGMRVTDPLEPSADFGFLTVDLEPEIVPAIVHELMALRDRLDGKSAMLVLERARRDGARAIERRDKSIKGRARVPTRTGSATKRKAATGEDAESRESDGNWLQFVLAQRKSGDATWEGLARLYGMLRVLESRGTTDAARAMIDAYAYFGELVRIDLQRALARMKDHAVAALIEAKEHEARKVREWARRRLDAMSKAIAGEAVSTTDPEALAEILRAFGRIKDLDAARVILSYTNSDRVQVRVAAREAVFALGEPALWQLKDAYESLAGQKPSRSWDHKRVLQELFRLHDQGRLQGVYAAFFDGEKAAANGDVAAAVGAFDQVLARTPLFERRAIMAPSYALHARELERAGKDEAAEFAYRKALRLAPDSKDRARIESRLAYLEGKALAARGTLDPVILRTAIELDPDNAEARALLDVLEADVASHETRAWRYLVALAAALVALIGTVLLARRPRSLPTPPSRLREGAD